MEGTSTWSCPVASWRWVEPAWISIHFPSFLLTRCYESIGGIGLIFCLHFVGEKFFVLLLNEHEALNGDENFQQHKINFDTNISFEKILKQLDANKF